MSTFSGLSRFVDAAKERRPTTTVGVVSLCALLGGLVAMVRRPTESSSSPIPGIASGRQAASALPRVGNENNLALPPPEFTPGGQPAEVETVPGSPFYDPTRLMAIMSANAIFEQEPRVTPWAQTMESSLQSQLARELPTLVPGATLVSVECKTTTCKVTWQPTSTSDNGKLHMFMKALYMGSGAGSGSARNEIVLVYGGGTMSKINVSDARNIVSALPEIRKRRLTQIRRRYDSTGTHPRYPGISVNDWPKE